MYSHLPFANFSYIGLAVLNRRQCLPVNMLFTLDQDLGFFNYLKCFLTSKRHDIRATKVTNLLLAR